MLGLRILVPLHIVAVLGLSACGGAQSSGTPCPLVIEGPIAWSMTSPPDGATGVPVNVGTIVVPGGANAPTGASVVLTPNGGGAAVTGGAFVAETNGTDAASVPTLAAHTSYTVTAVVTSSGPCPNSASWNIGAFSTQ